MKTLVTAAFLLALSGVALAGPTCNAPKDKWMKEADFKAALVAQGYLVLGLGLSGWMQTLDAFWGEEWLQDIHLILGNTLIGLVGLHAAAALLMGRLERTHLIRAMFTGIKVRW